MRASCSSSSKSVRRAFVRARIAIARTAGRAHRSRRQSPRPRRRRVREGADHGFRAVGQRRAQVFSAPPRFGRACSRARAPAASSVVLLEPDDERVREAARDAEQVLRPGAGERVDRLVVVADDAKVVAVAEPVLEQLLLQQVDVLILVDGERSVLRAKRVAHVGGVLRRAARPARAGPRSRSGPRPPSAARTLGRLGASGRGDRGLPAIGLCPIPLDGDAPVLRPFDLRGQVAGGTELEGRGRVFAIWRRARAFDGECGPRGRARSSAAGGVRRNGTSRRGRAVRRDP